MNKYELGRTLGDKALCIVVDGDTAICTSGDTRLGTSEHAEHMTYLVKAGNAHDELIAALRDLELMANTVAHCYMRRPENFVIAMRGMVESAERARAALAKAGAA